MLKPVSFYILLACTIICHKPVFAKDLQSDLFQQYLSYNKVLTDLENIANNSTQLKVELLTTSAGNKRLVIFSAVSSPKNPALFVTANLSGTLPISTSGALYLAQYLANNPEYYQNYTWYILPCGNPDAYISDLNVNTQPLNATSINADMDDQNDEDGPDDLNNDGIIGHMRIKDPLGQYTTHKVDTRLLIKAKNETPASERYSLYTEGLDNDGDGFYNEDGKGGVNIANTFPYNFKYDVPENGKWSGSEKETRAILEFFSAHPEICLTLNLGTSDFLRQDFISSKETKANTYNIPKYHASSFGVSDTKKYTINELIKIYQKNRPTHNVDELYVMLQLKKSPLQTPFGQDMADYTTIAQSFKNFTKNNSLLNFIDAENTGDGSFELWSYYHLGLPSIAMRLWDIPDLRADSLKSGKTKKELTREQAFIVYSDSLLDGLGFTPWKTVYHPDFNHTEVGGFNHHYMYNPTEKNILPVLEKQIPWIAELTSLLPEIYIDSIAVKPIGKSTYHIDVFVSNKGKIAAPLFIGGYNRKPAPIILTIPGNNITFLAGKARTLIKRIEAGKTIKVEYILSTSESSIDFIFDAPNVTTTPKTLKLK